MVVGREDIAAAEDRAGHVLGLCESDGEACNRHFTSTRWLCAGRNAAGGLAMWKVHGIVCYLHKMGC
jgi:hypothetical protein